MQQQYNSKRRFPWLGFAARLRPEPAATTPTAQQPVQPAKPPATVEEVAGLLLPALDAAFAHLLVSCRNAAASMERFPDSPAKQQLTRYFEQVEAFALRVKDTQK